MLVFSRFHASLYLFVDFFMSVCRDIDSVSMENQLHALCSFGGETAITSVPKGMKFCELVGFVARKWSCMKEDEMTLRCGILGYSKCILDGDADVGRMIVLCKQMKVSCVDIQVIVMETDDDMSEIEEYINPNGNRCGQWDTELESKPNCFEHRDELLMG